MKSVDAYAFSSCCGIGRYDVVRFLECDSAFCILYYLVANFQILGVRAYPLQCFSFST